MSLSSHSISSLATPDEAFSGSRKRSVGQNANDSDAVFKLPDDVINRKAPRQDTIFEAISKEEARTDSEEDAKVESIRQNNVRQSMRKKEMDLDNSPIAKPFTENIAVDAVSGINENSKFQDVSNADNTVYENVTERENIAEGIKQKAVEKDNNPQLRNINGLEGVVPKDVSRVESTLGTSNAIYNGDMSPLAIELPISEQSLSLQGSDAQSLSDRNSDSSANNRFGSHDSRDHKQNFQQNESKQDSENLNKEREQLLSMSRPSEEISQQANATSSASDTSPAFNVSSATESQASASSVQVEIVTGIMKQVEQLRQNGRTSMQITLVLPEGQELKLHLRASDDHVQIKMDAKDQEVYEAIYMGWPDLTEQAARKGIRLDSPSFIGREQENQSSDSILNASA